MEEELYGYSVAEIKEFVGKRNAQYLERFNKSHGKRKFNFAAAFFGGIWFGYRKMWLEGIAVIFCCALFRLLLIAVCFVLLFNEIIIFNMDITVDIFLGAAYIINFIVVGFIADSIYWKNIKKRIDFLHLPEEIRENKLGFVTVFKQCKGVSIWLGALTMLGWNELFNYLLIFFALRLLLL